MLWNTPQLQVKWTQFVLLIRVKSFVFFIFFGGHWYLCFELLVTPALGFTDTPVLDFWWRLPWLSLIPLFWTSGDVCPGFHWYPCFGLLVTSALVFTDTPDLDLWWCLPWVSLIPLFWTSSDVCPGFHWYPLFWTSGDACPGFQSSSESLACVFFTGVRFLKSWNYHGHN